MRRRGHARARHRREHGDLRRREQAAADAIRYGLGFGDCTDGILSSVTLKEAAVVECLRHLIPFADLVKEFLKDMVYLKSF